MIRVAPDAEGISQAAAALKQGGVIMYPTETVYGLGADPSNLSALERLFRIKERDPHKPVLLLIGRLEQIKPLIHELSPAAQRCVDTFWPGPLSLVLPARKEVPACLAPDGKVCIRYTSSPMAADLCRQFGSALTSTSANRSGEPAATDLGALTLPGVALGIDAGPLPPSPPSTVYDPDEGRVLRQGAILEAELTAHCRG